MQPFCKITPETVLGQLETIDSDINLQKYNYYQKYIKLISSEIGSELLAEDYKQAKSSFYFMVYNN
jgi:hypothetical protein